MERVAGVAAEAQRALVVPFSAAAVAKAAEEDRARALRYGELAAAEPDPSYKLIWLELAGIAAVRAKVLFARATEAVAR